MRSLVVVTGLVVLGLVRSAAAIPYEAVIAVEDEADLQDLLAAREIAQDTYDELSELLERGIDLTTADRARLYALPNLTYDDVDRILALRDALGGAIRDPAALVAAGVLTEDKLRAIAAFLERGDAPGGPGGPGDVHGRVALRTRWTVGDDRAPPTALQARLTPRAHLTLGAAGVLSRMEIGDPIYDPDRAALIAAPRANRVRLPRLFAHWEDDRISAVAGTFRAGFGQRLVFDNTIHAAANGLYGDDALSSAAALTGACNEAAGELLVSPCSGPAGARHVTPDWGYRAGLLGAGVGVKRVALGPGWLQAYAWASAQKRSIYQYELVVPAACPDPRDDDDPACAAPPVFVRPPGERLTSTAQLAFATLPDMFLEKLVGGNVAYFADGRSALGATVYGAAVSDLVAGIDLDTQEWSRQLTGRRFGAAGIHASLGRGAYDGFVEIAHSYDRLPAGGVAAGGGGPAAIVRVTRTGRRAETRDELELVARYYATDFANPFARPVSQPDELDGQRARDELGARLRYHRAGPALALRASLDAWVPPSTLRPGARATPRLEAQLRGDLRTGALRVAASLRYQDSDLRTGGRGACAAPASEPMPTAAPAPCAGRQLATIGRAELALPGRLTVAAAIEHQLLDAATLDPASDPQAFRQDLAAWASALWRPTGGVRLRARVRYREQAIASPRPLETSLSASLDGAIELRRRDLLRLRVEAVRWLDDRMTTALRAPNPELQLWLGYEARL